MNLIHTIDRKALNEGRTSGLAIGLAKKVTINRATSYILATGMSCCKDYLNDVVAVENSGFRASTVYGFRYDKNKFKISRRNILVARNEHYPSVVTEEQFNNAKSWMGDHFKTLRELNYHKNIDNAVYILNKIEKEVFLFKNDELTTIDVIEEYDSNDGKFLKEPLIVAEFSNKWLINQTNISLFSNLLRRGICVQELTEEEKLLPILDFIKMLSKKRNLAEGFELSYLIYNSFTLIRNIFNNKLKKPLQSFTETKVINSSVHNFGIQAFNSRITSYKTHGLSDEQILERLSIIPQKKETKEEQEIKKETKENEILPI